MTVNEFTMDNQETFLKLLEKRFKENMKRHENMAWPAIKDKLITDEKKLQTLMGMENSGGEPDVIEYDEQTDEYVFFDCSKESPTGRRSVCFDEAALASRKKHKPENSAEKMAEQLGIELLTERQYPKLQEVGEFDLKTSSWIQTPDHIRQLGGALFCDRRYDTVFVYHNGAESYYAARGFRGALTV